jgi:hypothetical protein
MLFAYERPLCQKQPLDRRFLIFRAGLGHRGWGSICDAVERSLAQPGYDIRPIVVAWAPHDGPWKEKLRREEVHLDLAPLFALSAHSGAGGLGLSASTIAGRLGAVVEENRHLRLMDDRRRTADVTLGTACGLHRPFFQLR